MTGVANRRRGPDLLGKHAPVERTRWRFRLEYPAASEGSAVSAG